MNITYPIRIINIHMEKWINFKVNKRFKESIETINFKFFLLSEFNILIKYSMLHEKKIKKCNSLILKLFYKYFCKILPSNYIFEIRKTKQRVDTLFSSNLFLQFPEGMRKFYEDLKKIFKKISKTIFSIAVSCQITYGACCIQDCLAKIFCSTLVIHYGHSCLISILNCIVSIIYIFIEVKYDFSFLTETVREIFTKKNDKLMITSTIQFSSELKLIKSCLSKIFNILHIPQTKPLSPGEVLGCTSFSTKNQSGVLYIGDGKFHIESVLFFNPNVKIVQFNPLNRSIVQIGFKFIEAIVEREYFIEKGLFFSKSCNIIFGALGRQGNMKILKTVKFLAGLRKIKPNIFITTEIDSNRLGTLSGNFNNIWVQLSCPRISLDWGFYFKNLIITPFEFAILTRSVKSNPKFIPMDFYSKIGKFWTSYSTLKIHFIVEVERKFLNLKKYNYFKNFI